MSEGVFMTESATKPSRKVAPKAAFRAALRGTDADVLREAVTTFSTSPQFDENELVLFAFVMKPF